MPKPLTGPVYVKKRRDLESFEFNFGKGDNSTPSVECWCLKEWGDFCCKTHPSYLVVGLLLVASIVSCVILWQMRGKLNNRNLTAVPPLIVFPIIALIMICRIKEFNCCCEHHEDCCCTVEGISWCNRLRPYDIGLIFAMIPGFFWIFLLLSTLQQLGVFEISNDILMTYLKLGPIGLVVVLIIYACVRVF
jgi:hypothetical protein